MPINGHSQNMLNTVGSGVVNVCVSNGTNGPMSNNSNSNSSNNGSSRNGHHRSDHHLHNASTSSSPTGFMHDTHSNSSLIMNGPMSPNSQDGFPPNYDIAAHLKRKELFTQRKQREFIPDNKKDDSYWDRRRRNNEAAKRSREKRRYNDMVLEQRVVELTKENHVLKAQLDAIKDKYNICGENLVSVEQIMATLPTTEQVLSITKRPKFNNNNGTSPNGMYPESPGSPIPTSVIQQTTGSVDSSSPPVQSANSSNTPAANVTSVVTQATPPQIQTNATVVAAAAFVHLNNGYMDASSQRNAYKYHENGNIVAEMERHEIYGARNNFHNIDHHSTSTNNGNFSTNGCTNGNSGINSARYSQHIAPIPRCADSQNDYHRTQPHTALTSHHLHSLQHFDANDGSSVNKISQSNRISSDTDLNAFDDETNVLNLSRRRNSDITNTINSNNSNNKSNNNNHKSQNGSGTLPRNGYASIGNPTTSLHDDDQYSGENLPLSDTNNSLPLKLRHKSHLGDKDAATALLALQHIKQEPNLRLSPPWDGEGSSDERDSGISIGTAEWGIQRKIIIPSSVGISGIGAAFGTLAANLSSVRAPVMCHLEINSNSDEGNMKEENVHLKTQIARLESEVASIKNMMILNTNSASATAVQ